MSKKIKKIAELLPEGLTEESVVEIAELVAKVIDEEVKAQMGDLANKVFSFLKLQKEQLKEQALLELEQQNMVFRNAKLFEEVRTLMSIELSEEDEDSAVKLAVDESDEAKKDMTLLVEEFEKLLEENDKLEKKLVFSNKKLNKLNEEKETLLEAVDLLEQESERPFESSERAIVISENSEIVDATVLSTQFNPETNPLLSEESIELM